MTPDLRQPESGLSLVEMLVALVLFALVGLASFAMLDAIITARDRTEGRLASIAQLDRAMTLFSRDLMQSLDERTLAEGRLGLSLYEAGTVIGMQYRVQDGALIRSLRTDDMPEVLDQALIGGIAAVQWRFLDAAGQWVDVWPPSVVENVADGGPVAVEMQLTLSGDGPLRGTLRRIVELPHEAQR